MTLVGGSTSGLFLGSGRRPTRRRLIASLAALGAGATFAAASPAVSAEPSALDQSARPIDVHHHFFPPAWLEVQRRSGAKGTPAQHNWSAAAVLEHMDKAGVATA